jgi:hypothetical protein
MPQRGPEVRILQPNHTESVLCSPMILSVRLTRLSKANFPRLVRPSYIKDKWITTTT